MLYCNIDDLIQARDLNILIQLSNDGTLIDESGNLIINNEVCEKAIQKASVTIQAYLTSINLDESNIPTLIKGICVDIAMYHLYARRQSKIETTDTVYIDYKQAVNQLEMLQKNKINTQGANDSKPLLDFKTNKTKESRYFNASRMRGFYD